MTKREAKRLAVGLVAVLIAHEHPVAVWSLLPDHEAKMVDAALDDLLDELLRRCGDDAFGFWNLPKEAVEKERMG